MTALFIGTFIAGLLIAVRVMLFGIERDGGGPAPAGQPPTARYALLAVATFLVVFGVVGYLTTGRVGTGGALGWAAGSALVAAFLAVQGGRRWAAVPPEHDVDDPRYVLQGHLARVSRTVPPVGSTSGSMDGEITFEIGTGRQVLPARAAVGGPIAEGTEVVIERIEDDVAYVEPWADVEERL